MRYCIKWKNKATKALAKIQEEQQQRIIEAVKTLSDRDSWHNVRPLVNHECTHRLRIGQYRVLFSADDSPAVDVIEIRDLEINDVKKRDDRTY